MRVTGERAIHITAGTDYARRVTILNMSSGIVNIRFVCEKLGIDRILNTTDGSVYYLAITASESSSMTPGVYNYDLVLTTTEGDVYSICHDAAIVIRED